MRDALDKAIGLARMGFYVFPLLPNSKLPAIRGFPTQASRDEERIQRWFTGTEYNIGISTSNFGEAEALVVVDVDNKNGKNGTETVIALELAGFELPRSFEQATPSGGKHIVYRCPTPMNQGAEVLGSGVDIRSRGGYIVGPGSVLNSVEYAVLAGAQEVVPAPDWLLHRLQTAKNQTVQVELVANVSPDRAYARAVTYLASAPIATEGSGGDTATFRVAAELKDLGCTQEEAARCMMEHWNDRCCPPWTYAELSDKVAHAFKYGKNPAGVLAPEAVFPKEPSNPEVTPRSPMEEMNSKYAFVLAGGGCHILHETTDQHGDFDLQHVSMSAFHALYANQMIQVGKKTDPLSKAWMEWKGRRTYQGLVFEPAGCKDSRFYNMWRGFATKPAETADHWAVEMWKEHAFENVCAGDQGLFHWLMSWLAHIFQKPNEKPLVACAFRGAKGVGKNAVIERVGGLLGNHFFVTSNRRYLTSNFTGHLEKCLLFVLDEAFWSGDKQAEGIIKDLITGTNHVIEHKGDEPYTVKNLTRIVIVGNEDWIVPATADERRWAVFDVGSGRRADRTYFRRMKEGIQQGGNAHLLRYLLDYNMCDIDVAPDTAGLLQQKHASLEPLEKWWLACLLNGTIVGSDFQGPWPQEISTDRFRGAFSRYCRELNVKSRLPDASAVGKTLSCIAPSVIKQRTRKDKELAYMYSLPPLKKARSEWEKFIGGVVEWEQ